MKINLETMIESAFWPLLCILVFAVAFGLLGGCAALETTASDAGSALADMAENAEPSLIAGAINAVAPGISPWALAALFPLLFKRSRGHLKDAVTSAAPVDGKVDVIGAALSVAKALGLKHSDDSPA
jgi:hypothetical protein